MHFNVHGSSIQMAQRRCRRGATVFEYVVVIALVGGGVLSSLYLFSACGNEYEEVAARIGEIHESDTSVLRTESAQKSDVLPLAEGMPATVPLDFRALAIVMLGSMSVIGLLYARLALRRHSENKRAAAIRSESRDVAKPPALSAALEQVFRKRNTLRRQLDERWSALVDGYGTAEDYMSTGLFTIVPKTGIPEARKLLKEKGFRRVLVVTNDGRLAGIVSKKDLVQKQGEFVSDVMTADPIVAEPELRISLALSIMLKNRISCVPVVKDGFLVGLLSTSDLMMLLQCVLLTLEAKHGHDHTHEDDGINQLIDTESKTKKASFDLASVETVNA